MITGRSDATLNRGGVRLGTGEFYAVVEDARRDRRQPRRASRGSARAAPGELILFVVPPTGVVVDDALRARIAAALRGALSPRHVPDTIEAVPAIPRTLTAKKLELPVKRILLGRAGERRRQPRRARRPAALDAFVAYRRAPAGRRREVMSAAASSSAVQPPGGGVCTSMAETRERLRRGEGRGDRRADDGERVDGAPSPERWRMRTALGVPALDEWTDILAETHLLFDVCSTQRTPSTFYGAVTRRRFGDLALVDCGRSPFLGAAGRRSRPRSPPRSSACSSSARASSRSASARAS